MSNIQSKNGKYRLIVTAIAFVFAGIVTGLFLDGSLLPIRPAVLQQYQKITTTENVVSNMIDGTGEYTKITTVIATETTPHGYSHDFAATLMPDLGMAPTASTPVRSANEIWVGDRNFNPSLLTVPVGTTVTWTSKSGESHTVTSVTGIFDEGLGPGTSVNYTFNQPGTYDYYCTPHGEMQGVIIVK